jgi:hypothetical protein
VRFPVESYLSRIARLAEELAAQARAAAAAPPPEGGPSSSSDSGGSEGSGAPAQAGLAAMAPAAAVAAAEAFLFEQQRLRPARGGRSALPARALLTHPGVYESAQPAYLNEVRIRSPLPYAMSLPLVSLSPIPCRRACAALRGHELCRGGAGLAGSCRHIHMRL